MPDVNPVGFCWPFKLEKKCDFFGRQANFFGHFWMARFGLVFVFGQYPA